MKTNKVLALLMASVMLTGCVTACDQATPSTAGESTQTSETSEGTTAASTAAPDDLPGYLERSVTEVTDEDDGKITIFSNNAEFMALAEKYAGITSNDYDFVEINDLDDYRAKLDAVLADGNGAPDIFICDESFARQYLTSDDTIAINDIGIDYAEMTNMFDYTLRFAADDQNVIKGLAWKLCPTGVFYEKSVAEKYLGTSDPNELASNFATWDAVLASAKTVNENSEGSAKLISGFTETYGAFMAGRKTAWLSDGKLNFDPQVDEYFKFAKTLYDDDLTFRDEVWSDGWKSGMTNRSVVSYWGSLQFAKYELGLNPGEGTTVNPTAGDWGITTAPANYISGGCWVMVSKYCDKKATAADIIRAVCLNEDNLKDMVNHGEFVNNIKLMTAAAADDKFALEWLGGQNPYPVLLDCALKADASLIVVDESKYDQALISVVGPYCEGAFETVKDAKDAMEEQFTEKVEQEEEEE
jgi:maltose-binding protein MalE